MRILIALVLFCLGLNSARAGENAYDVVGKVLAPFVSLLAKDSPPSAARVELTLQELTNAPKDLLGAKVQVALQRPDKLRLEFLFQGEPITIGRQGNRLWAHPGGKVDFILRQLAGEVPEPETLMPRLEIGLPKKQLVFLPALFQVRDLGEEVVGAESCRVLELKLMPELARSAKLDQWVAKLWVRADYKPAALELIGPEWRLEVGFNHLEFTPALPPETWQPTPGQASDLFELKAPAAP